MKKFIFLFLLFILFKCVPSVNTVIIDQPPNKILKSHIGEPIISWKTGKLIYPNDPKKNKFIPEYTYELLYIGLINSTIIFQYREYSFQKALSPSFSQFVARFPFFLTIHYNLEKGDILFFKKFKFQVLEANNQFITYKILKVPPKSLLLSTLLKKQQEEKIYKSNNKIGLLILTGFFLIATGTLYFSGAL